MTVSLQLKTTPAGPPGENTSIVFRAKIFFCIVCLSLLVVNGWQAWKARAEQLRNTETGITNMARALAQHGDDTLTAADLILSGIVEDVESGDMMQATGSDDRLHRRLKSRAAELTQLAGLFVLDAEGNPIGDSQDTMYQGNVSSRSYFQYHLSHQDRGPHIGPLIKGSAGAWRLTVSRRLDYPDGRFRGVALAAVDIDYFRNFYDTFSIGDNGLIILGLNDGTMLVRRPFFDKYVGVDLNNVPIFRDYVTKNHDGTHTAPSTVDGKDRINAYRHFNQFPLFVAIALSKEEVLNSWVDDTLHHTVGILILILFLALLGNWLLRQIKLRLVAEAQLRIARDNLDQLNKHLQNLALEDGMTGLANRRHFDIALSEEFSRALRHQQSLALIMIDVDWFKQFNDIYGHRAGDDCLRRVAALIKSVSQRAGDITARYGGEEMVVLLPQTTLELAAQIAERIRSELAALHIAHTASPLGQVTISAGVAAMRPQRFGDSPGHLVEEADLALYAAKAGGRNCVICSKGGDKTRSQVSGYHRCK